MKQKSTPVGKPGGNYPEPAPLADTSRTPVGGQKPPVAPLPGMDDAMPWLREKPASKKD
jgi:hypothetical protein